MASTKDKRLQWTPTLQVRAGLKRLEDMGLYGDTLSHVVNHIVTAEITRLLKSGLLTQDGLDAERKQAEREFGSPASSSDKD